jgi:hypothetical protein
MLTKAEMFEEINRRAQAQRRDGETKEAAFARYVTKDEDGIALASVHKMLPGPDWRPEPDPRVMAKTAPPSTHLNTLMALAEELRKENPKLTKEQAFAKVYGDPRNRDLVDLHKAETSRRAA